MIFWLQYMQIIYLTLGEPGKVLLHIDTISEHLFLQLLYRILHFLRQLEDFVRYVLHPSAAFYTDMFHRIFMNLIFPYLDPIFTSAFCLILSYNRNVF